MTNTNGDLAQKSDKADDSHSSSHSASPKHRSRARSSVVAIQTKIKEVAGRAQHELVKQREEHIQTWVGSPQPAKAQPQPKDEPSRKSSSPGNVGHCRRGSKENSCKTGDRGRAPTKERGSVPGDRKRAGTMESDGRPGDRSRVVSIENVAIPSDRNGGGLTEVGSPTMQFRERKRSRIGVKGRKPMQVGSAVYWLSSSVKQRMREASAYMGVDWYTIEEKRRHLSVLFLVENLYFWCYAGYIVVLTILGGLLMWALEPKHGLTLAQALYSSAACVSQSGLSVADWSQQSNSTYIVSFCLIILGSASLLHMVPVWLRRMSFQMQAKLTNPKRRSSLDFSRSRKASDDAPKRRQSAMYLPLPKRAISDPCLQVPLIPVEPCLELDGESDGSACTDIDQEDNVDGDPNIPKKGFAKDLSALHAKEYRALSIVLYIMAGYWITTHLIGIAIFWAYFRFSSGPIVDKFYDEGLHPGVHAVYLTVSSFQNNGLVLTPSSVMDFAKGPLLLNTISALIICGNTGLPIMVRLIATCWHKLAVKGTEREKALSFLLQHPRRCFTHMFPAVHTAWLLLVIIMLNVVMTLIQLWQDSDSAMRGLSTSDKVFNAIFQSVSSRTAGLNSVNIADFSQATTFVFALMMYLATTPTVVIMRVSASKQELDITGRPEGVEEEVVTGDNSLKSQARRYLSQDLTYLAIVLFFICVFEKEKFVAAAKNISPDSDGIYFDFSFFKVLFELISAYGTCGLSLGYRNQTMSFSGVWTVPSQMLLIAVMILGRLRGLPDSIDPSVRVTMEDNQEAVAEHKFIQV